MLLPECLNQVNYTITCVLLLTRTKHFSATLANISLRTDYCFARVKNRRGRAARAALFAAGRPGLGTAGLWAESVFVDFPDPLLYQGRCGVARIRLLKIDAVKHVEKVVSVTNALRAGCPLSIKGIGIRHTNEA